MQSIRETVGILWDTVASQGPDLSPDIRVRVFTTLEALAGSPSPTDADCLLPCLALVDFSSVEEHRFLWRLAAVRPAAVFDAVGRRLLLQEWRHPFGAENFVLGAFGALGRYAATAPSFAGELMRAGAYHAVVRFVHRWRCAAPGNFEDVVWFLHGLAAALPDWPPSCPENARARGWLLSASAASPSAPGIAHVTPMLNLVLARLVPASVPVSVSVIPITVSSGHGTPLL